MFIFLVFMGCFIFPGLEHSRSLHYIGFKSSFIPISSEFVWFGFSGLGSFISLWINFIKILMKAYIG